MTPEVKKELKKLVKLQQKQDDHDYQPCPHRDQELAWDEQFEYWGLEPDPWGNS